VTVREQLAGHVRRIQAAWEQSPPTGAGNAVKGFRLESPPVALPMTLIRRFQHGVNRLDVGGAPAGHLAIVMFRWDQSRYPSKWDLPSVEIPVVAAEFSYCSIPWDQYAHGLDVSRVVDHRPRDFAELLDAWDAGATRLAPMPARAETWRDLPPLL
jgi:hypothetical protein